VEKPIPHMLEENGRMVVAMPKPGDMAVFKDLTTAFHRVRIMSLDIKIQLGFNSLTWENTLRPLYPAWSNCRKIRVEFPLWLTTVV